MQATKKRHQIIEAATRRLAHFGLQKTNMADIAQDLGISKASLYYYFPDKSSLYSAVFNAIVQEEALSIQESIDQMGNCQETMMEVLGRRNEFVKKYYTILSGIASETIYLSPHTSKLMKELQQKQANMLEKVFEKGVKTGEIDPHLDLKEAAQLFLVALEGMRFLILNEHEQPIFPTEEEFDQIYALQKKMSIILLRGMAPQ
jgi:TetR/AcrR family transcriptional regulator